MSTEDLSAVMREISEKLDGILGFMAVRELKGDASLIVPKLKALGMSTKTIALVSGISENAVAIRLTRMKKPAARRASGKGKKASADSAPASVGVGSAGSDSGKSSDSEA